MSQLEVEVPPSILRRSLENQSKPVPKETPFSPPPPTDPAKAHKPNPPPNHYMRGMGMEDDEDEDFASFQNIDPLNTSTDETELDTIRNNYRDLNDSLDVYTATSSSSQGSPMPRRPSVFPGHEHEDSDDFSIGTMLAIRTAVLAGLRDASKQRVDIEDFSTTRKHKISMAGDRKVEVKDYAPVVFALLRRKFGISISSYLLSWSDHRLAKAKSQGKSDSMFIHSPDNKFVLKTLVKSEAKRLLKILQSYYEHMTTNEDTFLSRIYGLHRMTRRRGQSKVYFFILNNVFETQHRLTEIYDLKGSTVGRRASSEPPPSTNPPRRASMSFDFLQLRKGMEQEAKKKEGADESPKKPTVQKDLDFKRKLHVGPDYKKKILVQLAADCKFLAEHKLMDYSLLIGVRNPDSPLSLLSPPSSTPASPASSMNISRTSTPVSSPDVPRVPGLLFFLESTKAVSTKPAAPRDPKKSRRKSLSLGKPTFATAEELNVEDEDDSTNSSNTSLNHTTNDDESATEPADSSSAPNNETDNDVTTAPPANGASAGESRDDVTATVTTTNNKHNNTHTHDEDPTRNDVSTTPPNNDSPAKSGEPSPPSINVTPASPLDPIAENGNGNGNGKSNGDVSGLRRESFESTGANDGSSASDSPPKRSSIGLLAADSVPHFSQYIQPKNKTIQIVKSGSAQAVPSRGGSAQNTPKLMKKPSRSSSLTYFSSLEAQCDNPHIPFFKAEDGGMRGSSASPTDPMKKPEIYYVGIIDFLQKYNTKKMLAGFAKSFKYEKEELSTVDPEFYMERFMKMVEKAISE